MPDFAHSSTRLFCPGLVSSDDTEHWRYRCAVCPNCQDVTIEIARFHFGGAIGNPTQSEDWRQVYPIGANRGPVPPEVPEKIAEDYIGVAD
jgi:hypothetical protein